MTIAAPAQSSAADPCATGSATTTSHQCILTTADGTQVPACVVLVSPDPGGAQAGFTLAVFWEKTRDKP